MTSNLIEKQSTKSISLGTILGYVALILSIVSGLIYTPWIKETIGKGNYGLYTLSTSLINLFLIDFGLSTTANTFLAKYRAKNDVESTANFLAVIYKIFIIVDVVVLIAFTAVYFCIDYIYVGLTPEELSSFKIIFLIAVGFSIISFPCTIFSGIMQAYEKFVPLKIIDIVHRLLFIATSAVALLLGWNLIGLVIANFGSALVCYIFRYIYIRRKIKVKANFHFKADKAFIKSILFYSGWAAINSIVSRLVFNVMPSILGIVSDSQNIATFGFIMTLEGYVYMFGNVMGGFFLPKITRLKESGSREEIDKLAVKVAKIQLFIVGLIFVGFVCCGRDFISLWLNHDPDTDVIYLGTMMIITYQLVYVPEIVYYSEMFISNKVKPLAIGATIKAVLNCGLAFLLGYFYGAMGAAISVAISRVFELIYINVAYQKSLGIKVLSFLKKVYLKSLIVFALSIGCMLPLALLAPLSELWRFLICGIGTVIIFTLSFYFVAISKDERSWLVGKLKLKRNKKESIQC